MICNKLKIRPVMDNDSKAVKQISISAYGKRYKENPTANKIISLIAECDGNPVGHINMSKIDASNNQSLKILTLSPLAVIPKYREMQVGSQLVRHAIKTALEQKYEAIFVLDDPLYYERFGFSANAATGFKVQDKNTKLLALELKPNALKNKKGTLIFS